MMTAGLARLIVRRFAIALAVGQIDVEHMDLVVRASTLPLGPNRNARLTAILRLAAQRQRADMQ